MAHYAKVVNGEVVNVIVAEPEFFNDFIDDSPGEWIKTSYNMYHGIYWDQETNQPAEDQSIIEGDEARERKNFAAVGFKYDRDLDAFVYPKPFDSWLFDEDTCDWNPPVAYPDDGQKYIWNEENQQWDLALV